MAPLLPIHSSFQSPSFKVHFTTRGFPFNTLLKPLDSLVFPFCYLKPPHYGIWWGCCTWALRIFSVLFFSSRAPTSFSAQRKGTAMRLNDRSGPPAAGVTQGKGSKPLRGPRKIHREWCLAAACDCKGGGTVRKLETIWSRWASVAWSPECSDCKRLRVKFTELAVLSEPCDQNAAQVRIFT